MQTRLKRTLGSLILGSAIVLGSSSGEKAYAEKWIPPSYRQDNSGGYNDLVKHGVGDSKKDHTGQVIGAGILLVGVLYVLSSISGGNRRG